MADVMPVQDSTRFGPADPERSRAGAGIVPLCFVVDDERGMRQFVSKTLNALGVMTEEYTDAPSMLAALARRAPDLILLDVALAGSDAIEAIQGLRAREFGGAVGLMSGRCADLLADIQRIGERHGLCMLPPLQKPFRSEAIRSLARQQGLARGLQQQNCSSKQGRASTVVASLDEAHRRGWLEVWYQPKFDLRHQRIAGAEALIRARHPEQGVLSPASFLPGASEASLVRLTEHVFLAALRDWADFADSGALLRLAINVPVSALTELPIVKLLREHRPHRANWPGLILEVTEDEVIRDVALAHEVATQLRIYGVTLAIDDFGAGYSSLARLRDLPFAELKLDRSFVVNCGADQTHAGLCQTIVDLAHRFGRVAVAEGIESSSDLEALHRMGCDMGQGFLLAAPMPRDCFSAMLQGRAAPAEHRRV